MFLTGLSQHYRYVNMLLWHRHWDLPDRNSKQVPTTISYTRSGSGQSMMTMCSILYGFRSANSKNSVVPIDTNMVCSVVIATLSMFIMPSLLLCARNISIVRRSRIRSSFSRCIDYATPTTINATIQYDTVYLTCSKKLMNNKETCNFRSLIFLQNITALYKLSPFAILHLHKGEIWHWGADVYTKWSCMACSVNSQYFEHIWLRIYKHYYAIKAA